MNTDFNAAEKLLIENKIGVLPTDTVYGIHGKALNKQIVQKIYELRERDPKKPFIILISKISDIKKFEIIVSKREELFLNNNWPNKLSVIIACKSNKFKYLHRGTNTLAFRIPKNTDLRNLLAKTGPLISTSVNPQGMAPAKNILEAKAYFGNKLDFYVDSGELVSLPSTLIEIKNGEIKVLRQGEIEIKKMIE